MQPPSGPTPVDSTAMPAQAKRLIRTLSFCGFCESSNCPWAVRVAKLEPQVGPGAPQQVVAFVGLEALHQHMKTTSGSPNPKLKPSHPSHHTTPTAVKTPSTCLRLRHGVGEPGSLVVG